MLALSQRSDVGVQWFNAQGNCIREGKFDLRGVKSIQLHATSGGLGLQTNDQYFWWLGTGTQPLWNVRVKPYIYKVFSEPGGPVFVGTDGNGGRLYGFEAATGREILNLKPAQGGVATLSKVSGHPVLVDDIRTTKNYAHPLRLLIVNMNDCTSQCDIPCHSLVGTWQHGAVCRVGVDGSKLGIVDVRDATKK